MPNKSYAEFLGHFVGKKGKIYQHSIDTFQFIVDQSSQDSILEVGDDFVVLIYGSSNRHRLAIPIIWLSFSCEDDAA